MSVSIRRAKPADLAFLLELVQDGEVAPYLARRGSEPETIERELERSEREPDAFGRFMIEVDGERAGTMRFERATKRSRIAHLGGLAVLPRFRGRRLADEAALLFRAYLLEELGFHRLELEIYGFNERAMAHAERIGMTREGVKRKAYLVDGEWVDGVLFGLVVEDLEQ